ncbi:head maturation protease, ClpP-related [Streptomyces sp. NPDC020681]|uniref:head maturation protease, ClpP-related n=1 Tax=Streptomyces sp. NPDC020681 TaxID=3365083 RepID=UPI00379CB41C
MTQYPRSWRISSRSPQAKTLAEPSGRQWYRISNATAATAEVAIYDEVGFFGTNAADFTRELKGITASSIDVRLNSPGGEVFDGIAIYEALRQHPAKVTTYIDGLAASIASVIAMAGDRRIIGRNATMMIHEANGVCIGECRDMRELADLLDKTSNNIADVYAKRSGRGTVASWRALMKGETWFVGAEAVEAGLATEQTDPDEGTDFAALAANLTSPQRQSAEWAAVVARLTRNQ